MSIPEKQFLYFIQFIFPDTAVSSCQTCSLMTVTMSAAKKRTSPQDWIHDYYGPILTVCASDDAEMIANKNNLTFTELLQPFSKLGTDVTIKDVDGQNHNVPSLNIILQDFKKVDHHHHVYII